jgi:hypothetical protein
MLHETLAVATSAHFALTHPAVIAAFTPVLAAGTDPFAGLAQALLDVANTIKIPFAAIAFIIAGAMQAFHNPRASGAWITATLASVFMFGATGAASYLQANIH